MNLTEGICKDSYGYHKFVGEEHQYACNSTDYARERNKNPGTEIGCCQGPLTQLNSEDPLYDDKGIEHLLGEARKSFMSGHSSFSFYCATFLVMYLHARLSNEHPSQDAEKKRPGKKHFRILFR